MKLTSSDSKEPPVRHWEKRVLYAYLRMMGSTQKDAGSAVGRAERTAQLWEADVANHRLAREEARQRWLGELTDAARVALLHTIQAGDGGLSLRVLERIDSDLAPSKQEVDVTGTVKVLKMPAKAPSADAWKQARPDQPPQAQAEA